MATKYQDYLAANVLNESKIVSYRYLSRALKVHSNVAKEMLYDFHRTQNARKPGCLHASYLVGGVRKLQTNASMNGINGEDGGDISMQNSSFLSSSMPEQEEEIERIPVTTITLAREEDLDAVKCLYETISSIHIYSLEPGPLQNLQVLSDCNRRVAADFVNEDLLETWKQYGTIHNPNTKRRISRRPPPPAAPQAPMTSAMKAKPGNAITTPKPAPQSSNGEKPEAKKEEAALPSKKIQSKPSSKPPTLKRDNSSIFKSFAKAKSESKKEHSISDISGNASPAHSAVDSPVEDEPMKDASEDEEEDDEFPMVESAEAKEKADANRKAKSQREAHLRKMMEDNDEDSPMDDSPAPPPAEDANESQDHPSPNPSTHDSPAPEPEDQPQQPTSIISAGGRRRGLRKVLKKKTTKDAEGYLVTREEPVWESFSEDEPPPKKAKLPPVSASIAAKVKKSGAAAAGGGAAAGKVGQGNIMSFFAKK